LLPGELACKLCATIDGVKQKSCADARKLILKISHTFEIIVKGELVRFSFYIVYVFLCSFLMAQCSIPLKTHERWWDANVETMMLQFEQWFGDCSSTSRVQARQHIKKQGYKTILDIPCSLGTDFWGFQQDGIAIAYLGIDISPKFVELALSKHIPVLQGDIKHIPCKDSSFEVCYVRHILEHMPYYEDAFDELIRVARSEVLVIFFIRPQEYPDTFSVVLDHNSVLYYNCYNRTKLSEYVLRNHKVASLEWDDVDGKEIMLHIYLK
jgi:ubiquinone/menaquinone biosynthesis C-methylase UbiE